MNPRLIKFAVELQNAEKIEPEKKEKSISFKSSSKKSFFNFLNMGKVTIPITND